jgi:hypothetical protein
MSFHGHLTQVLPRPFLSPVCPHAHGHAGHASRQRRLSALTERSSSFFPSICSFTRFCQPQASTCYPSLPFPAMQILPLLSILASGIGLISAQYTIYQPHQQVIFGGNNSINTATSTTTGTAAAATYTGSAAYDTTILQPPPPPNPPVPTNQFVQLYSGGMNGLSIPLPGAFFGFSIEMSVASHVRMYSLFLHVFSPPTLALSL